MAAITTTGAGNWSSTTPNAPWPSGTIPSDTDTVTIDHDVTNDYTPGGGADHCAGLTINASKTLTLAANMTVGGGTLVSGTLALATYSFECTTFGPTGSGDRLVTGSAGCSFVATSTVTTGYDMVIGSVGATRSTVTLSSGNPGVGRLYSEFNSCDFSGAPLWCAGNVCAFYDCDHTASDRSAFRTGPVLCVGGYITNKIYGTEGGGTYIGVTFSKTRLGADADNGIDIRSTCELHSCWLYGTALRAVEHIISEVGTNGDVGFWRRQGVWGYAERSTAAKKSGDYGIEIAITLSSVTKIKSHFIDIPIPVNTGDTVAPSIYYQNVTADLDLEAAAGRLVFELDPGDEWGLNEVIDVNGAADSYTNWRQVTFTGGTAGGTAAKGTVILRVTLARYVATGVVYLADLDPGVS